MGPNKHAFSSSHFVGVMRQDRARNRQIGRMTGLPISPSRTPLRVLVSGLWADKAGQIAIWLGGAWTFLSPKPGFAVHVEDERLAVSWVDGAWRDRLIGTEHGGGIRLVALEQELTLAGAFVETKTAVIADRMMVLGVASRTTQAITGATSYSVGIAGEPGKFGSMLGIALGSTNIGVIGPTAFYAPTPIRITAAGGSFTSGKLRLVLYAMGFAAPEA
jgi:hypothetical protein